MSGCSKCGCPGGTGGNGSSSMESMLANALQDIQTLQNLTQFLTGHPIMEINDPSDIVLFDPTSAMGSGPWIGWALCDGQTHSGITTPDLRDRFVVGAGNTYAVDATGGLDTVTLTVAQMPSHNHPIVDPGHTHVITDPGHTHAITDPGHTHAIGGSSTHTHSFTTNNDGSHVHMSVGSQLYDTGGSGSQSGPDLNPHNTSFADHTSTGSNHQHTGVTDPASISITITAAFTGIANVAAFTGITINTAVTGITDTVTGGGLSHENKPPFWALFFVKKIF
jgi:microcystin-dependent protein